MQTQMTQKPMLQAVYAHAMRSNRNQYLQDPSPIYLPQFTGRESRVNPLVRVVRPLPYYDGINGRYVLTGQSAVWALVNATARRSPRLSCGEYGQI